MNRRLSSHDHAQLRCAAVLAGLLAASCSGDEFQGTGSGGASTTDAASSAVGSTGTPSTSPSSSSGDTTTTGEGGSPVSTSTGEGASSGEGGAGGGSGSGGSSGSGGGGGGEPLGDCDPEVSGDAPIPDDCGLFVDPASSGDAANGTKVAPYASLQDAVDALDEEGSPRRIYIQAGTLAESVFISGDGLEIHGGLSDGWSFGGTDKTIIAQPTGDELVAGVVVDSAPAEVLLTDLEVRGRSSAAPGASSIAFVVSNAEVALLRVALRAYDGGDGVDGVVPTTDIGSMNGPDASLKGGLGGPGEFADSGPGGLGAENPRSGCGDSASKGSDGGDGAPGGFVDPDNWTAEAGDDAVASGGSPARTVNGNFTNCTAGAAPPSLTTPGESGSSATGRGELTAGGVTRNIATGGGRGFRGFGGSGGGGGAWRERNSAAGDGGGGGSAGGCGGFGGTPGENAGDSIGIIAIGSTITFVSDVLIQVGNGGRGGDGAVGQAGAYGGGAQTNTGRNGCDGGAGGRGTSGGPSGAGTGGHSLGVAFLDTTFGATQPTVFVGSPGLPGASPSESVGTAASGEAMDFSSFD